MKFCHLGDLTLLYVTKLHKIQGFSVISVHVAHGFRFLALGESSACLVLPNIGAVSEVGYQHLCIPIIEY